jgi:hypothetical protein
MMLPGSECVLNEHFLLSCPSQASDNNKIEMVRSFRNQDLFQHYIRDLFHSQWPYLDDTAAKETMSQLSEASARSLICAASVGYQSLNYKISIFCRIGLNVSPEINKQAELYQEIVDQFLDTFVREANTKVADNAESGHDFSSFEVQMCLAQKIYSKV